MEALAEQTLTAHPLPRHRSRNVARLAVVDPRGRTRFVTLTRGETWIGRDSTSGVVLDDTSVSRRHCVVHVSTRSTVTVADLASHNGTRADDVLLAPYVPARLTPGSVIAVGNHLLKYVPDGAADSYLQMRVAGFSVRDPLTGVANRAGFDAAVEAACAQAAAGGAGFALVLCDVDRFKAVNDRYGHATGDAVLADVASVLVASTRTGDLVCRYGGEEFAIVMAGTDLAGAHRSAERLRAAVAARRGAGPSPVTASFGAAEWTLTQATPDALVAVADRCLYTAKASGRDRVVSRLNCR